MLLTRYHMGDFDFPVSYKMSYKVEVDIDVLRVRRTHWVICQAYPLLVAFVYLDRTGTYVQLKKIQNAVNEKCFLDALTQCNLLSSSC